MSETTTSVPLKTAACSATWDLIEQLVQLESSKNRLHLEYMGKAMPADVYLRFQNLRDERIPALRSQLRVGLAAAPDQPPAHFAYAYADQLMLRCLVPVEPAPQAQPADALEPIRQAVRDYHYALDARQHGGVAAHKAIYAIEEALGTHWQQGQETGRRAAMAAAQEGGKT